VTQELQPCGHPRACIVSNRCPECGGSGYVPDGRGSGEPCGCNADVTSYCAWCEQVAGLEQQLAIAYKPEPKWEAVRKALAQLYETYYLRPLPVALVEEGVQRLMKAYDEWLG